VLPFKCDWATERELPRLILICFETGRRSQTLSLADECVNGKAKLSNKTQF